MVIVPELDVVFNVKNMCVWIRYTLRERDLLMLYCDPFAGSTTQLSESIWFHEC